MLINSYQAKYFAYELSKKARSDSSEKFGATLMDAKVELNPHQVEAALFAFKSPYSKGAILADEVGLGKTIEAGILLSQKWAEGNRRILIICPSSLRKQWLNELSDKFYLKSEVLENASFNKKYKAGDKNPFDNTSTIKICSYQFARKRADFIELTSWDLVILDEAHYLRNSYKHRNQVGRTIQAAIKNYKKVLLTATPLQNRLDELFGLVNFIDPNIFGDIKSFRKNYVLASGNEDIDGLKDRLKDLVHRTLRKDVREFVPYRERIPITQRFAPTPKEQQLYSCVLEYLRQDNTYALPLAQKHLMESVIFKLLGSSSFAISKTLEALIRRLHLILENSVVVNDDIVSWFEEEYENFDDEMDELDKDEEEEETEKIEITEADKVKIDGEIAQLTDFLVLAQSIQHNAKGEKLLIALDKGFEKLYELGAQQKALVFTESTRTQQYLFERLSEGKYAGKVLLFNGSNTDALSSEIYKKWLENTANINRTTGSKSVDIRNALTDAFRSDDYQIMIATEAAAEGINLQFCSMVVNYDLPWNPQRVEQRIGRCHRYGQEFDVVVVNFLNSANEVEARVFELLEHKYNLFTGVFGSSDHVLGAIESGVDFEKRIIEIYKKCRTKEQIKEYFDALHKEFEVQIDEKLKNVQSVLFQHFEAPVIERLKITMSETKTFIEKFEKWLWEITRFYLKNEAIFEYSDFTFTLNNGKAYSLNKKREDTNHYRLQSDVAQKLINRAKKESTPEAILTFNFSQSGLAYKEIENLKSKKGVLKLTNLTVSSEIEQHSVLLFSGRSTEMEKLSDEMCRFILALPSNIKEQKIASDKTIDEYHQQNKAQKLSYLENADTALLQREFRKFNNWADDKINALEIELKDAKRILRELGNSSIKEGILTDELLHIQQEIAKHNKKVNKLKREMFDREDEINELRDQMITDAKQQLNRTIEEEEIFTIQFEII